MYVVALGGVGTARMARSEGRSMSSLALMVARGGGQLGRCRCGDNNDLESDKQAKCDLITSRSSTMPDSAKVGCNFFM